MVEGKLPTLPPPPPPTSAASSMFYFAVFFGDICQLLDQCCLSQLIQIQNVEWPEARQPPSPRALSNCSQ